MLWGFLTQPIDLYNVGFTILNNKIIFQPAQTFDKQKNK